VAFVAAADRKRELGLLSVVSPMYNESEGAREFARRVDAALAGVPYELVLVDDGSDDGTTELLFELAEEDDRIKVVQLSRNFGHQTALTAGLDHAQGDAVVMMDADLQDPPELIPELLARWEEGVDVVYAVYRTRAGETRFKQATAKTFYRLMSRLAQVELAPNANDFRLLDRRALDAVLTMRERNRFLRGMTVWVGYTQTAVEYDRAARFAGETKFPVRRMVRFSLDAISSFSQAPLQIATLLGFVFSGIAFIGLPAVVVARFFDVYVPGVSTLLFVVLLLGGIQLITVGLIGEYVGRIYDEVKRRPLYLVAERRNVEAPELPEDEAVPGART
jgi:dolichol-phosphate mannosyltransferase